MVTLSLLQAAATPAWVGPTMAISLAVIALSVLGMAIVVGRSVLRLVAHRKRIAAVFDTLQEDAQQALVAARRLTEQAQDLMVLVRHEAGAAGGFTQAGWHASCLPWLQAEIELVKPKVVLCLGATAARAASRSTSTERRSGRRPRHWALPGSG